MQRLFKLSFHISKRESWILLGLLFLIAVYLRLGPMVHREFWEDELFTISFASKPYPVLFHLLHPLDDRPPLFYLFTKALLIFTRDEFWLRLPSFLASLSCIWLGFVMFAKKSRSLALIVAALFTFSPFTIEYGWQLRDYGVLLPISLISMMVFAQIAERLWQNPDSRPYRLLIIFALLSLIGCSLNYIYVCFLLSFLFVGTIAVWWMGNRTQKILRSALYIWLFHLPVLTLSAQYIYQQRQMMMSTTTWIPQVSLQGIEGLLSAIGGLTFSLDEVYQLVNTWLWKESLVFLVVNLIGALWLYSQRKKVSKTWKFFTLVGIGTLMVNFLMIISISFSVDRSLFLPRTFLPAVITYCVAFGILMYSVFKALFRRPWLLVAAVLVGTTLWSASYWKSYFSRYPSLVFDQRIDRFQKNRPLVDLIKSHLLPTQHIVFLPDHFQQLFLTTYFPDHSMLSSRLAVALQERAKGTSAPLPLRLGGPVQYIILIRSKNYFYQDLSYYSVEYFEYNQKIEKELMRLCGGNLNRVAETTDFFVDECLWNSYEN
ncbi:hypothetical protein H3C70_03750 [Patescibacteria group bacterium]|nr:hypothetical protein [Patescibacteria group bacterium]